MTGTFILLVGPAGSGKSVLGSYIQSKYPRFVFPKSCTTREPRENDKEFQNRKFFSVEEFKEKIENEEFLEWAVYGGNYYGTLKEDVLTPLEEGKVVFKEVEAQGAQILKDLIPKENIKIIFIDAGSWEELERRVLERAPISEDELKKRFERYRHEMEFAKEADYVVHNLHGKLHETEEKMCSILDDIVG